MSGDAMRPRHALVTGASRGIGAAIARALADGGARLTLLGRDAGTLEALRAQLPGTDHGWVRADVTDEAQVGAAFAQAVQRAGPVEVLVNNAGAAEAAPLARTSLALWRRMLDVNLTGAFLCTREALPAMQQAGFGRIVNVASTAGLKGYAYVAAYCAAKHGLVGLTRALALEAARSGVTVNAVCPGYTETELLHGAVENIVARTGRSPAQARETLAAANPQGRLVQPEEVADAVRWLCGDAAASVTGQCVAVAGGEV